VVHRDLILALAQIQITQLVMSGSGAAIVLGGHIKVKRSLQLN
jgi:hypothetical protein